MQLNDAIATGLTGFIPHAPSRPKPTPLPERNQVLDSIILRQPINRQAAMISRSVRDWSCHPPLMPPEKIKTPQDTEIERLNILIKTERNAHAETRDNLGRARQEMHGLRQQMARLHRSLAVAQKTIDERDSIILQLEDIKL